MIHRRGKTELSAANPSKVQRQTNDHEAGDPQQSYRTFIAKMVVHGVAKVSKIGDDQ
jgi:hypothetical protein